MTDPTCEHPGCGPGHDCEGQRSLDRSIVDMRWARANAQAGDFSRACWHSLSFYMACPACRGGDVGGLRSSPEWPIYCSVERWSHAGGGEVRLDLVRWEKSPAARLAGLLREREWNGGSPMSRDRENERCTGYGAPKTHHCLDCDRARQVRGAWDDLCDLWVEFHLPSNDREGRPELEPRYPRTPEAVRAFFESERNEWLVKRGMVIVNDLLDKMYPEGPTP